MIDEKENKKNILIFLNAFWNNGKGMSGGDQMLIQVFKRIRGSFGKVSVYSNHDGKKVIEADVSAVDYSISPRFFDKFLLIINYLLRTIRAAGAIFKGQHVDIVYGGSDFFPDVVPAFLYKLFHPNVKWYQCVFHIYPDWKTRPGNKLANFGAQYLQRLSLMLSRKADVILNINYQVKDELVGKGFRKEIIFVNPPGIELAYLRNLKVSDEVRKYDASFLARLNPSKGIYDLVGIWKKVVERFPEAKLAVIGGGSEEIKDRLRKEVKEAGLENNIDILGYLENVAAFGIIKNSRAFMLPSHEEGFGIVVAEAMALGVPVVTWNLPVYDEVFENYSIRVEENDLEAFAERIVLILSKENEFRDFALKADKFVEKYSWDSIAKKHLEILSLKSIK